LYSITFDEYDYVFNEYTEFFTKLRKKSEIYNIFGKLMINSIYGRLGMKEIENYSFIDKKENIEEIRKKIDIISFKELNNIVMINCINNAKLENFLGLKKKKIKNNIIIAAAITSKARIKLYNAQSEVIKNKGRLLYSDTDSVFAAFDYDVLGKKFGEIY
jgi:DNA polymerase elongation subunit (family B)